MAGDAAVVENLFVGASSTLGHAVEGSQLTVVGSCRDVLAGVAVSDQTRSEARSAGGLAISALMV